MSTTALAPLAATIVNELPALIERTLKYNVENNIIENQLVVLEARIDCAKSSISAEREMQRRIRDKIKVIQGCPAEESFISGVSFGNTSIPSIHARPDQSIATVASQSILFSDSPVSLRTKRKGMVFSDEVRIVKKAKLTSHTDPSAKENCPTPDCILPKIRPYGDAIVFRACLTLSGSCISVLGVYVGCLASSCF